LIEDSTDNGKWGANVPRECELVTRGKLDDERGCHLTELQKLAQPRWKWRLD